MHAFHFAQALKDAYPPGVRLFLLKLLLLTCTASAQEPLTTTGTVRSLPLEKARQGLPVRLIGVVIYDDPVNGHAFLHDEEGSIFFNPGKRDTPGAVRFTLGERVEIKGYTQVLRFSPSIAGKRHSEAPNETSPVEVRRLGMAEWPRARDVSFEALQTGYWHDQLVRVRGVVRSITVGLNNKVGTAYLRISGSSGEMIQAILAGGGAAEASWLDHECEIEAVVGGGGNERGQLSHVRLLIPSPRSIRVDASASEAAFALPARQVSDLFRYSPEPGTMRLRVDGIVSLVKPQVGFFLMQGWDGLWVQTHAMQSLAVGDHVCVAGFPRRSKRGAMLTDGLVRITSRGEPPAARFLSVDQALQPLAHASLVSLEGEIVDVSRIDGAMTLLLRGGNGTRFFAKGDLQPPTECKPGARVLATGICEHLEGLRSDTPQFHILLRDAGDLSVLAAAPWWTAARRATLAGIVLASLSAVAAWVILLRRQVAAQTQRIETEIIQRTLVEERARLGRELHDTLEQQLAGLHLHLSALKDWLPDAPQRVIRTVDAAARMLEHCRVEARRSVLELRSQTLEREGLDGALRELAFTPETEGSPGVEVRIIGTPRRLGHTVEFHLLRCAQESLANALKHAEAHCIILELEYAADGVRLSITDDGRGFELAQRAPAGMHLGLQHLRERAGRIQGRLDIISQPGHGTRISLAVPA